MKNEKLQICWSFDNFLDMYTDTTGQEPPPELMAFREELKSQAMDEEIRMARARIEVQTR